MAIVLIVAEHDGKTLYPSTSKCVACAATVPLTSNHGGPWEEEHV